jgi:predicted phosphohydrolase
MPLTLQYTSDLHLEFPANKDFLNRQPIVPTGEVLVLAGDVVPFTEMNKHRDFFNFLSDHFSMTYWLPGNHEFYRSEIGDRSGTLSERIRENVVLVNNTAVDHGNVRLLFSTLWSRISVMHEQSIERSLSDFRLIRNGTKRFDAAKYNGLHDECAAFLSNELMHNEGRELVVCTHHCPTFMNYPPQYKGDWLNEAFATELFDLIESTAPAAWIYGHHHTNTPEFSIGRTRLLTNQLGYVEYGEGALYGSARCVVLG